MILSHFQTLMLFALAGSYERRGLPYWLSPLADPLAVLRIAVSTVLRPQTWRGREYSNLHGRRPAGVGAGGRPSPRG